MLSVHVRVAQEAVYFFKVDRFPANQGQAGIQQFDWAQAETPFGLLRRQAVTVVRVLIEVVCAAVGMDSVQDFGGLLKKEHIAVKQQGAGRCREQTEVDRFAQVHGCPSNGERTMERHPPQKRLHLGICFLQRKNTAVWKMFLEEAETTT